VSELNSDHKRDCRGTIVRLSEEGWLKCSDKFLGESKTTKLV